MFSLEICLENSQEKRLVRKKRIDSRQEAKDCQWFNSDRMAVVKKKRIVNGQEKILSMVRKKRIDSGHEKLLPVVRNW